MPRGDWDVRGTTFSQPPFAADNEPALILFPDPIPPELVSYYAPDTVVAAMIARQDDQRYQYQALVTPSGGGNPYWAVGFVNLAQPQPWVGEAYSVTGTSLPITTFGARTSTTGLPPAAVFNGPTIFNDLTGVDGAMTVGPSGSISVDGILSVQGTYTIDGRSAPRGARAYIAGTGTPSVSTGVRTTLLSVPMAWQQGRAYRISFGCRILMSTSTNVMSFVVTSAGSDVWHPGAYGPSPASDAIAVSGNTVVQRLSASGTETVTLAAQVFDVGTGTVQGLASVPYWLMIEDIGSSNDFIGSIAI